MTFTIELYEWSVWELITLGLMAWYLFAYLVVKRLPKAFVEVVLGPCESSGADGAVVRFMFWLGSPAFFPFFGALALIVGTFILMARVLFLEKE